MDAADLHRRFYAPQGWIHETTAELMAEHGFLDELRLQAEAGDWKCARRLAQTLLDQGRTQEALDLVAPFVATE